MVHQPRRCTCNRPRPRRRLVQCMYQLKPPRFSRSSYFCRRSPASVTVHPVALFSILDHFLRRKDSQERVIGTLLGTRTDHEIEVRNCFAVLHSETEDQVAVDMDYHRTMFDLHQKVNPKEVIVGWCGYRYTPCSSADAVILTQVLYRLKFEHVFCVDTKLLCSRSSPAPSSSYCHGYWRPRRGASWCESVLEVSLIPRLFSQFTSILIYLSTALPLASSQSQKTVCLFLFRVN